MNGVRGSGVTPDFPAAGDAAMRCEMCLSPVIEGPEGGYVCGLCFHVVEPNGYAERRIQGIKAAAEARRARTLDRRKHQM